MSKKVLIIGAGGVGNVVAHKCAMNSESFSEVMLASRNENKCKAIAADALAKALVDHALKSPGTEVIIVADERSLTGAAVHALDAVAKAGLKPRLQTRQPR